MLKETSRNKNYSIIVTALYLLVLFLCPGMARAESAYRVALFIPVVSPFWSRFTEFSRAAAKDLNLELKVHNAQSAEHMLEQVQKVATKGIDAILFMNYQGTGESILKIADQYHVPALLVNSGLDNQALLPRIHYQNWIGSVIPDDRKAGILLTTRLLEEARIKGSSSYQILAYTGEQQSRAHSRRLEGLKSIVEARPDVSLVSTLNNLGDTHAAAADFKQQIRKYPEINIVWSYKDSLALAAAETYRNSSASSPVSFGGIDWSSRAMSAVADGMMDFNLGGHIFDGAQAVIMVQDYLNGIDFADEKLLFDSTMIVASKKNASRLQNIIKDPYRINYRTLSKTHNPDLTQYAFDLGSIKLTQDNRLSAVQFTQQEKKWISSHPVISIGIDAKWPPINFIDSEGRHRGITRDYIEILSKQTGINFTTTAAASWNEMLDKARQREIDIVSSFAKRAEREKHWKYTRSYFQAPYVIATRKEQHNITGLQSLYGKTVAIEKGYSLHTELTKNHPQIDLRVVNDTTSALQMVSRNMADAYIGNQAVIFYLIEQHRLTNLTVAAGTGYAVNKLYFGIRNDWPELVSIIDKVLTTIQSSSLQKNIERNWLVLHPQVRVDYTLLYWVLGIALVIFLAISLRAREMARVNAKLNENRERLSLSLHSAELGTWELTFNKAGLPNLTWDETFASQHNLPFSKLPHNAKDFYNYLTPDYADKVKATVFDYVKGHADQLKVEYLTRYNKRWISSQGRIFERDAKGWANRIVGISQDITERKEASLAIERSNQFKSQFLANMSHEIRTPMNAIVGLGHLLSRTEINQQQSNYIINLQKSSQTLLALIDDILDLSKIEAGHLNIEKIEFSLEELLNDLANLSVIRITRKVDFIYDMGGNVPDVIMGDPFRLNQVLTNLVSNSIKFTDSGSIVLKVSVADKQQSDRHKIYLKFEVDDTGIGIAPDKLEKLFDPFVQEDNSTTRKYGGTGLGLSISKQLIELMEGELGVQSILGKGSKFYFSLPFTLMHVDDSVVQHTYPVPDLRGLKILLVDDNPLSLEVLSKTLQSMSFTVTSVSSGNQALQLLTDTITADFDVVLIDWRMPQMDGEKTALHIRKQIPEEKLPIIIMMTAYGREATEQQINHLPIDGFLVKPITPSQLFNAIIQARIGHTKKSRVYSSQPVQDDFSINPLSGHVILAEDNTINQQVAQEILQQMGLKVTICSNGSEVLTTLQTFKPDLILMDIQMPEMDGYQATREIRQDPQYRELPILAMTANAMADDIEKSRKAGMNDHISKPVDPQHLYQTLCQYLDYQQKVSKPTIAENSSDNVEKWPDSVPGINIKQGIKQVGGNEIFYQKLLIDFVQNHQHLVAEFEQALADDQQQKAQRLIHTIKGVSGNIGAQKLMEITTDIDRVLIQNTQPSDELMLTLSKTCEELFSNLDSLINHQYPPTRTKSADQYT